VGTEYSLNLQGPEKEEKRKQLVQIGGTNGQWAVVAMAAACSSMQRKTRKLFLGQVGQGSDSRMVFDGYD
jgi:hypothetical protein